MQHLLFHIFDLAITTVAKDIPAEFKLKDAHPLRRLSLCIVYTHLWLGLGAAGFFFTTCFALHIAVDFGYALMLCCGTIVAYALPIYRLRSGSVSKKLLTPKQFWAFKNPTLFFGFAILALIILVFEVIRSPLSLRLIPAVVLVILYIFPIIPKNSVWVSLRELGWLKNFALALAFIWCGVLAPMLSINQWHIGFAISQSAFILAICFAFDYRDIARDKYFEVSTLMNRMGHEGARRFIRIFNLVLYPILLVWATVELQWAMAGFWVYYPIHLIVFSKINENTAWNYFVYVLDGLLLVQVVCVWIISLLIF